MRVNSAVFGAKQRMAWARDSGSTRDKFGAAHCGDQRLRGQKNRRPKAPARWA